MGKSKKAKGHKSSRNTSSAAGPLIDKLLPKGLKGLQQSIFCKSNNADKTPAAKTDDEASTGTLSSQGSAVNIASAANSGSTHNMLPPIILGAQKLNSDSAKSVTSSGYGSMPGSTRNSVIETCLPPVLSHPNAYTSDSEIIHKSSPDSSPLAKKKWNVSGYRQSREETNPRASRNSWHKMSVVSTHSIPTRPSQSSNYSYIPMTITQLAHRQSRTSNTTSPSQFTTLQHTPRVVTINKYEYSLTSTSGHTNIEVRESKARNRKYSDASKKVFLPYRASIASLPPLEEREKDPNPRPQRSSYSFNNRTHTENNLIVAANQLSIASNSFNRRSSVSNHSSEGGHRRSMHRISITSVDDGRIPASNGAPAVIEEPVQRPTSKRRYGTIMLESPRLSVIQRADDNLTNEKPLQGSKGRRESLVVPAGAVPQIIFISPTPDPSHGTSSPSTTTSPSEQH